MPVYNAGCFLAPALESVLAQTFTDFELIAIDDGSTDDSGRVLADVAARDPRLRVFGQGNRGIVATLNRALSIARAPLIARMDADDLSRPDRFAKQVAYLRQHPEIAVVSGAMDVIGEHGGYLRTDEFPTSPEAIASELLQRSCISHPAVMGRTEVLRSVGGYRRNAQHAEDYDLWLRIAEVHRIANLPDVLLSYRMHPVKVSTQHHIAVELAALAVRSAARLRRSGKPDPLAAVDLGLPLRYRPTQQMFVEATPRPEFALSFFRAVLGRGTEFGSLSEWSKLYLRHGLRDLDAEGAATMILLLGHNMVRRWRAGAWLHAATWYPWWALLTVVRHPSALWRLARSAPQWLGLARARLQQTRAV